MKKKSGVLFLAPCFRSATYGGVQRSGALAWEALQHEGATLVTYGTGCVEGCSHSKIRTAEEAWLAGRSASKVLVWHISLAKLLSIVPARPAIVFLHGIECWRRLDRWTTWALKDVAEFWSNSSFTWKRFLEWNPQFSQCSHRVVPLGEGAMDYKVAHPDPLPSAVILGRMDRREDYKGHRELIAAWGEVRQRVPQARLDVIGDGNLRPELERQASHLGSSIRFHGLLPEQKKIELLRAARCMLMPSRGEGFGLVYLEAMRLGRPCLVSSEDAGHEVVNPPEAGMAAPPTDRDQLVQAIVKLMAGGAQWDVWSDQARRRYGRLYTTKQFQQRITHVLKEPSHALLQLVEHDTNN